MATPTQRELNEELLSGAEELLEIIGLNKDRLKAKVKIGHSELAELTNIVNGYTFFKPAVRNLLEVNTDLDSSEYAELENRVARLTSESPESDPEIHELRIRVDHFNGEAVPSGEDASNYTPADYLQGTQFEHYARSTREALAEYKPYSYAMKYKVVHTDEELLRLGDLYDEFEYNRESLSYTITNSGLNLDADTGLYHALFPLAEPVDLPERLKNPVQEARERKRQADREREEREKLERVSGYPKTIDDLKAYKANVLTFNSRVEELKTQSEISEDEFQSVSAESRELYEELERLRSLLNSYLFDGEFEDTYGDPYDFIDEYLINVESTDGLRAKVKKPEPEPEPEYLDIALQKAREFNQTAGELRSKASITQAELDDLKALREVYNTNLELYRPYLNSLPRTEYNAKSLIIEANSLVYISDLESLVSAPRGDVAPDSPPTNSSGNPGPDQMTKAEAYVQRAEALYRLLNQSVETKRRKPLLTELDVTDVDHLYEAAGLSESEARGVVAELPEEFQQPLLDRLNVLAAPDYYDLYLRVTQYGGSFDPEKIPEDPEKPSENASEPENSDDTPEPENSDGIPDPEDFLKKYQEELNGDIAVEPYGVLTSADEIRAVFGLSDAELPTEMLTQKVYIRELEKSLRSFDPKLSTAWNERKDEMPKLQGALQDFAVYSIAVKVSEVLPLIAARTLTDSKATFQRFDTDLKEIAYKISQRYSMALRALGDVLAEVPSSADPIRAIFSTSRQTIDPVTGEEYNR